ncbi:hypothetical protein PSAB6_50263 [Paraburkholderia sabiae]|nr:hypothetical protein PSAB6_50263 [Paraburkholderia sabiae]
MGNDKVTEQISAAFVIKMAGHVWAGVILAVAGGYYPTVARPGGTRRAA